jgi:hypothetical protein
MCAEAEDCDDFEAGVAGRALEQKAHKRASVWCGGPCSSSTAAAARKDTNLGPVMGGGKGGPWWSQQHCSMKGRQEQEPVKVDVHVYVCVKL